MTDEVLDDEEDIALLDETTMPEPLCDEEDDEGGITVPLAVTEPDPTTMMLELVREDEDIVTPDADETTVPEAEETTAPEAESDKPEPAATDDQDDIEDHEEDHITMPELDIHEPLPTPLLITSTASPGSIRLTKHVSIPAEPVPEMGKVTSLPVLHTARNCP